MEDTKVWVNTATIHSILHPDHSHTTRRLGMHGSLADDHCTDDSDTVRKINWGWVPATITSGGHSGNDGTLDATTPITVCIEDEESEYHRTTLEIPGGAIEKGHVVMANYHGDEDGEDLGFDDESETEQFGLDGEPLGYPDDLITLTHLHEPAVLHCLRKRFDQDKIYTNTGPILIALNPFKSCKSLYSDTIMKRYWERGEAQMLMGGSGEGNSSGGGGGGGGGRDGDMLAPHVYDLADGTYRSMMLKIDLARAGEKCDQSILVSGESGAGKTVTTKFIMQYLATLSERRAEAKAVDERGGKPSSSSAPKKRMKKRESVDLGLRRSLQDDDDPLDTSIEQQVLQSNPILESFGNARTIRNDNSSRFGKFIEIRFDPTGTLVGASIETYLLEKVRLISQAEGERNYHVFYEMLSGMTEDELDQFLLGDYAAEDFKITSCSGTFDRRDGVLDTDTYEDLVDALEVMGFTKEQQDDVFSIASAVLHLSNLGINPIKGGEECEIDAENEHLEPILKLLGVTKENLNQALCYFKIEARGQSYTRAVQKDKAEKGLEALMKATYSAIFDYVVKRINASITVKKKGSRSETGGGRRSKGGNTGSAFIGVLDIFGFESFKVNSFEQLCINYCNEALQQQFNLFVLKNEQDEYEQEGIKWSFISFPDNQDALDLIWKKGYGILNILDDQCRAPGTTDKTFANDLYQKLSGKPRFEANFRQVGARQFGVFHYAGLVEYETDGFVEKNRDELPKEASDLLLSSSIDFVKELASIIKSTSAQDKPTSGRAKKNATVGGHFAKQLQELRAKIDLTSPHYVRCLKPNAQLVPDNFDPQMIVEQLRCAGVVEAVRVSRVGYPQRYSHSQFISRYRTLGMREMKKAAKAKTKVKPIAVLVDAIAKKMALTDSKVSSADEKNSKSHNKVDLLAIGVQVGKTKVFLRRRAFDIIEKMRKDFMVSAAMKVQAVARGYIQYRTFHEYCEANLQLQCWARVIIAERKVQAARECFNATRIQAAYRKFTARRKYSQTLVIARWCQRMQRGAVGRAQYKALDQMRSAAISIQCAVRIRKAIQVLESLKAEAKNLSNISEERDKFRNRMEEMRLEMDRLKEEKKREIEEAAKKKETLKSSKESDLSKLKDEIQRLNNELSTTRKHLAAEQQRSENALASMHARELELEEAKESVVELRSELDLLKSQAGNTQAAANGEEDLQQKLDDALAESSARGKEIKKLKKELRTSSSVPKPQSISEPSEEQFSLLEELEATKAELVAARKIAKRTNAGGTSLAPTDDVGKLQQENEQLRKDLEQALSRQLMADDSMSVSKSDKDLKKENSKLKKEVVKLKEANKKILETAEEQFASLVDLEDQNATLRKGIDGMQDASSSGSAADASAYGTLKKCLDEVEARLKAEQARSESAIAREKKLRNQVAELRLRSPKKNGTTMLTPQTISEDEATNDVATLQFEIERLRSELEAAKDEAVNAKNNTGADDMIRKYDELRRLAESGMQKDIEIQELKLRVSTQDAQLRNLEEETTEEDLCFGVRQYREDDDAIAAAENEGLRGLNEELQRQLQVYKKEAEGAQNKLKEEAERSEMEMKAFSVALKGVDDLRVAAEHMSRELHHIKKHGYVPPGGLTGEDTTANVQSAMSAIRTMATANQSIDRSSTDVPNQQGFSLWAAMNSVLSGPGPKLVAQATHEPYAPSMEVDERRTSSRRKSSKKKKKKNRGDEGSIISSFF